MNRLHIYLFCIAAAWSVTMCDDEAPFPKPGELQVDLSYSRLVPAESCADLEGQIRRHATDRMHRALWQLWQDRDEYECDYEILYTEADYAAEASNDSGGTGSEAQHYTQTNNQVEGVDEADFIKNDGQYIYAATGQSLFIVKAWPPTEADLLSQTTLEGEAKKILIDHEAQQLVVFSSVQSAEPDWWQFSGGNCSYGYDCQFTGDGYPWQAAIYNIADRSQPRLLRKFDFSGSLTTARFHNGTVYAVLAEALDIDRSLTTWVSYCDDESSFAERLHQAFHDNIQKINRWRLPQNIIAAENNGNKYQTTSQTSPQDDEPGDNHPLYNDCQGWYTDQMSADYLTSIVSFSLAEPEHDDLKIASIVSRPGTVYANSENLYLGSPHLQEHNRFWFFPDAVEATTVHRFDLNSIHYTGSAAVQGRILNQFSMDEYQGHLRLATSTGWAFDPNSESQVYVLDITKDNPPITGLVDGLAPSEDIRSVRFVGRWGYVVTFKKTDPLFIIDLENPSDPRLVSELKVPGFSTYMHPLGDDYLLTIGFDVDEAGSFAFFDGIQLQIFDVSDKHNPSLAHKIVIGTRGTASEAATNHLAFTYRPDLVAPGQGMLAVPMTICDGGGNGWNGSDISFNGLMLFDIDVSTGLDYMGGVSHSYFDPQVGQYFSGDCSGWWTNSSSLVKRSILMDNYAYSITENEIRIQDMSNLGTDIKTLYFGEPSPPPPPAPPVVWQGD